MHILDVRSAPAVILCERSERKDRLSVLGPAVILSERSTRKDRFPS